MVIYEELSVTLPVSPADTSQTKNKKRRAPSPAKQELHVPCFCRAKAQGCMKIRCFNGVFPPILMYYSAPELTLVGVCGAFRASISPPPLPLSAPPAASVCPSPVFGYTLSLERGTSGTACSIVSKNIYCAQCSVTIREVRYDSRISR